MCWKSMSVLLAGPISGRFYLVNSQSPEIKYLNNLSQSYIIKQVIEKMINNVDILKIYSVRTKLFALIN